MANDSKIVITAGLQIPESVNTITKDLKQVSDQLDSKKSLKITCNIDLQRTTQRIQSQLNTISNNLNLNLGNSIKLDDISKGLNIDSSSAVSQIKAVNKEIDNTSKMLADIGKKYTNPIDAIFTGDNIVDAEKMIKSFKEALSELGTVSIRGVYENIGSDSSLRSVEATITNTSGEVLKLNYQLDDAREKFRYVGSSYNDKGVIKQIKDTEKAVSNFKKQLSEFESSHVAIESGLVEPLQEVRSMIDKLANGEVSIDETQKALDSLKATAADIGVYLKPKSSSFNIFDNAVNKAENFENKLKEIELEINKLSDSESKANLLSSLSQARIGVDSVKEIENAEGRTQEWAKAYDKVSTIIQTINNDLKVAKKEYQQLSKEADDFARGQKSLQSAINTSINSLIGQTNNATFRSNSSNTDVTNQINQINALKESYTRLLSDVNSATSNEDLKSLYAELAKLTPEYQNVIRQSKELQTTLKDSSGAETLSNKIKKAVATLDEYEQANKRVINSTKQMSDGTTFSDAWIKLRDAFNADDIDSDKFKHLNEQLALFKKEADAAGLSTSKFFDNMGTQLRTVIAQWVSLYAAVRYIREMVDNVIDLDNAMIDLRRVTEGTNEEYSAFLSQAKKSAVDIKTTTSALTEQAYQWSKLGYSIDDALSLAEDSIKFAKTADISNETAQETLVTAMKAYNLEANQALSIGDKIDKLNNQYAVNAAGLAEGLTKSASALSMTNNSLEQNLALLTGIGEITQDVEGAGNAIKIVALRLQNMKGKLEELGEPVDDLMEVSKVQTQILNLTGNRVNIFDQQTQEFRATYDVLKDIADVWDSLSSMNRASLTEILFGKNRANQGLAAIQAFQSGQVENAYRDALDAAGTVTEEYGEIISGIQGRIDGFKTAFESLSNTVVNSEGLKWLIDTGTKILNLLDLTIDKVGILPVLIAAADGALKLKTGSTLISNILSITNGLDSMTIAAGAATVGISALKLALGGLVVFGTFYAIKELVDYLDNLGKEEEVATNKAVEAANKYKEENQTIKDLTSEYTNLAANIDNVASNKEALAELQDRLSDKYGEEASGIDLVNGKYDEQIEKLNELSRLENRKFMRENLEAYNKADEALRSKTKSVISFGSDINALNPRLYEKLNSLIPNANLELASTTTGRKANSANAAVGIMFESDNLKEQLSSLRQIKKVYSSIGITNLEFEKSLNQQIEETTKAIEKNTTIVEAQAQAQKTEAEYADYDSRKESLKEYEKTFDELYKKLSNQSLSPIEKADTENAIANLKSEMRDFADGNSIIIDELDNFFDAYDIAVTESSYGTKAVMDSLSEYFDGTLKDGTKTIDRFKSALQSIAEGKAVSFDDAWEIINLDQESKILSDIKATSEGYIFDTQQLISLKDNELKKMIAELELTQQQTKENEKQLQLELEKEKLRLIGLQSSVNSASDARMIQDQLFKIQQINDELESNADAYKKSQTALDYLNSLLGDTVDYEKVAGEEAKRIEEETDKINNQIKDLKSQISALNDEIESAEDNAKQLLQAQEDAIDNIVDTLNDEKEVLEENKTKLEQQLELLEKQKDVLESNIENYKTAASIAKDVISEQVEEIETQQNKAKEYYQTQIDELEKYYDELKSSTEEAYASEIDAINEANDKHKEEIDLLEKENALKEKQIALENARNKKVRTYDSTRGFVWETDKENLNKAQQEYNDAESNLIETKQQIEIEAQINKIESDRDKALSDIEAKRKKAVDSLTKQQNKVDSAYQKQIDSLNEYAEKWENAADSIEKAEKEAVAAQVYGSNWRDKILSKDAQLLTKFTNEYNKYNSKLKQLTDVDIANVNKSIEVAEKEVEAKDKQIDEWNKYKNKVQTAAKSIENALNGYTDVLNQVALDETSNFTDRESNLKDFSTKYTGYLKKMTDKQKDVEKLSAALEKLEETNVNLNLDAGTLVTDVNGASRSLKTAGSSFKKSVDSAMKNVVSKMTKITNAVKTIKDTADAMTDTISNSSVLSALGIKVKKYATGGVNNTTGLAWLDGTRTASETIFNASDSKKLWDFIHETPNLVASVAANGLSKLPATSTTNNSSKTTSVTNNFGNIITNSPENFARYLDGVIDDALIESKNR